MIFLGALVLTGAVPEMADVVDSRTLPFAIHLPNTKFLNIAKSSLLPVSSPSSESVSIELTSLSRRNERRDSSSL
jgi:hypothetical protein